MKKNQYALITGATSGIGYELAKLFAEDGWNIIAVARHEADLKMVQDEFREIYHGDFIPIPKDLFNPTNATELYNEIREKDIEVEVLVNNAGQGVYGSFVETNIEKELAIIRLNIESVVVLTKHFLNDMVLRGHGRILNLSSIASKSPGPLQSVYHGTKAFIQSFTEAIREEVKDSGVTVTALLPGVTDTDFFRKADMLNSKAVQHKAQMANPAAVAKDGYEALMKGDDMIVSGIKNKVQVAMSNIMPDSAIAAQVHKQQAPVKGKT